MAKGAAPIPSGYRKDIFFRVGDAHAGVVPGPFDLAACWAGDGAKYHTKPGLVRVWSKSAQTSQWPNSPEDLSDFESTDGAGVDDWDRWVRKYVAPGDVFAIPSSWGDPPPQRADKPAALVTCWNLLAPYVGIVAWNADGGYTFTPSPTIAVFHRVNLPTPTPPTGSITTSSTSSKGGIGAGAIIGGLLFVVGGIATAAAYTHDENRRPRGRGRGQHDERALASMNPTVPITLERVYLDRYGYERSGYHKGRYWGTGAPLYRADNDETGELAYFRASDRKAANAIVRGGWSHVKRVSRGG